MNSVRVVYPDLQNSGDMLNVDLLKALFSIEVVRSKVWDADLTAIGGAISGVQYSNDTFRSLLQRGLGTINRKPLHIWGSGFLLNNNSNKLYRKDIRVCALRGDLSRRKLSGLMHTEIKVPLVDPGLLIDRIYTINRKGKYAIGVIPHFSQQEEPAFQNMCRQSEDILFIDITKEPKEVYTLIAKCGAVVSSSLHGLVFADSMGIPSMPILGREELLGGSFKFRDYYSSFGLDYRPWTLNDSFPRVEDIKNNYQISYDEVLEKQEQLIACFPAELLAEVKN